MIHDKLICVHCTTLHYTHKHTHTYTHTQCDNISCHRIKSHHYICIHRDNDDVEDLPAKRQRLQGRRTTNKKD